MGRADRVVRRFRLPTCPSSAGKHGSLPTPLPPPRRSHGGAECTLGNRKEERAWCGHARARWVTRTLQRRTAPGADATCGAPLSSTPAPLAARWCLRAQRARVQRERTRFGLSKSCPPPLAAKTYPSSICQTGVSKKLLLKQRDTLTSRKLHPLTLVNVAVNVARPDRRQDHLFVAEKCRWSKIERPRSRRHNVNELTLVICRGTPFKLRDPPRSPYETHLNSI